MRFVALFVVALAACSAGSSAPAAVVMAERPAEKRADGSCYPDYHRAIAGCRAESGGAPSGECINAAEVRLNACLDGAR